MRALCDFFFLFDILENFSLDYVAIRLYSCIRRREDVHFGGAYPWRCWRQLQTGGKIKEMIRVRSVEPETVRP